MKTQTRNPIVSLVVVMCLLVVPLTAFAKKGRDHFKRGLKHEQAQQWDKAAQEYTLALASDPSNAEFQLHYRRATFNASQMFMQQGRAMAEQRDYIGAYNAFRQAFGYDPVNQLAVSEMERMLRLQEVKEGGAVKANSTSTEGTGGTPAGASKPGEEPLPQSSRPEQLRQGNFNGDLKHYIRTLAEQLGLNVVFDKQSFAQPRNLDMVLTQPVTTAKALDYIFLQESLFFQKLDRHTILVADQARRPQYQQLVVRTFFISNADPEKVKTLIGQALPASVGRPSMIVVADKDTNSLTVRDTAENVRLIGELIQSIDKDRAEVVMDVDIYEVSQSDLLQFGNQIGTGTGIFSLGGSPGLSVLSNNGVVNNSGTGVNLSSVVGQIPTALAAALVIPPIAFTAFRSKDNTKLIASTQVHAFNGEESKARIGQRVPVQTAQAYPFGVQTGTPQPGQGAFPSGGFPVINYEPTGLTLTFTPQVFPNLDVQVKMNIESKDVLGGEGLTPTFTERTITGTARVQNNRTMLLASVSQDVETKGRRGLPVLGGLPIVGRLFTSPTRNNRRVDIVIAVTPRVLRAPALTPRDEEMRPSGTLQSPTTGSLEAMLRENYQEEQILAARRIPKEVNVQLPDAPTYVPAARTETPTQAAANNGAATQTTPAQTTTVAQNNGVTAKTEPAAPVSNQAAATNGTSSPAANDSAMPQPKAASFAPQTAAPETNKLDVATAIKSVVTPTTEITATSATAKTDANVAAPVEDLAPKPAVTDASAKSAPLPAAIELGFASETTDITVGEKRQLSLELNSPAPLGVAVVMLRFDPNILKITNVTAGKILTDAKSGATISVMKNEGGVLLVSIAPAAGATISGAGTLLNLEVEGLAGGSCSLAFDLSSVHIVTADGSASVVQVSSPVTVFVKAAAKP
ncbi:MAG TPA: secretin N-terminal domain-containing protein [Pyrinomonadaceae bacterium]|nr:secretin N-terminal domain-containing protein [Pyrinomonadaceae bacterium]